MFKCSTLAQAVVATVVVLFGSSVVTAVRAPAQRVPVGFKVLQSSEISPIQRNVIAEKLGAKITRLSNTTFSVYGRRLHVNVIECPSSAEAIKIHESVGATKKHPAFCIRADSTVVEFVSDDSALAILAAFELGFKPKPKEATYKISFRMAPVEKIDYTSWKKFSNLFLSVSHDPNNLALKSRIERLAGGFRFGNDLIFRTLGTGQADSSYSFEPKPTEATPLAGGDLKRYTFQDLPREVDIPVVSLTATIHTAQDPVTPTTRKAGPELLKATEFWPSDDPNIIALAALITVDCSTPQGKTEAILKWLLPGENISFAESIAEARYGVKKVISQKFGQAWDFSDCFVTLARASKVPCRQVAGWFYPQSVHVWAEVLYEDSGWQQVEPTGGGIVKCGIYYIAYLTSEDGRMPILYLSLPKIKFLNY